MKEMQNQDIAVLCKVIAGISDPDEVGCFLEDLCTIKEIQDMAQRFRTAVLLDEGMNYQNIASSVGISTATISRVSRCLNYGAGGYRKVLDEYKKAESENGSK